MKYFSKTLWIANMPVERSHEPFEYESNKRIGTNVDQSLHLFHENKWNLNLSHWIEKFGRQKKISSLFHKNKIFIDHFLQNLSIHLQVGIYSYLIRFSTFDRTLADTYLATCRFIHLLSNIFIAFNLWLKSEEKQFDSP